MVSQQNVFDALSKAPATPTDAQERVRVWVEGAHPQSALPANRRASKPLKGRMRSALNLMLPGGYAASSSSSGPTDTSTDDSAFSWGVRSLKPSKFLPELMSDDASTSASGVSPAQSSTDADSSDLDSGVHFMSTGSTTKPASTSGRCKSSRPMTQPRRPQSQSLRSGLLPSMQGSPSRSSSSSMMSSTAPARCCTPKPA
jgi:hypothetical protein